jgi:hypothetical protein
MSISANGKILVMATKELSRKWDETKESWQDAKSREFEQKYLFDLLASVERAVPVFDDLDKLISRIRSDCE